MDLDLGFQVADCEIRPRHGTITRRGEEIHIEPKIMGVLVLLAQHAGEVVKRQQFMDVVWSEVVVQDEAAEPSGGPS